MTLDSYTNLIKCLPYLDQAFETKKSNWKRHYEVNPSFNDYCNNTFSDTTIKLSRNDLFNKTKEDPYDAIVSIIFWGYKAGMHGHNFTSILKSIQFIIDTLSIQNKNITETDFEGMLMNDQIAGVGLSTLTKFLYFFGFKLNGYQCLILDKRIIDVINDECGFIELEPINFNDKITDFNKAKRYPEYLKIMAEISKKNNYKPDQLELFLFSMGKNLKTTIAS